MTEYSDVPDDVFAPLRSVCMGLPDAQEQEAWAGRRWSVRRKTFAHVLTVEGPGQPTTVLTFRSSGAELGVLHSAGHPFFRPGWGSNTVGMVLDDDTDWDEVEELVIESYCVQAPRKLVALVDRPPES